MKIETIALIVAAGESSRFGAEPPKPYIRLGEKAVLRHSIDTFLSHPGIGGVRVVISRPHHPLYRRHVMRDLSIFPCVIGGATRQESVRRGLESIARANPTYVLIHDAARPLLNHALIDRVLESLKTHSAALPTLPIVDTLRRDGKLVDREHLLAAQTPQGFRFDDILAAHRSLRGKNLTDDIALAEAAGLTVGVVAGERRNLKLTTQEDLPFMEALATPPFETRVGTGIDIHPFVAHDANTPPAQRTVTLCGVKIPHEFRLHGHSDADAGLHALVDAILGAIGAGDIGQHFPPDDRTWAGADSSRFLIHAYQMLKTKGGDIVNIDITILGEKPRIAPFREQMVNRIADMLKLSPDRINIKATTTEKLGFLGRGEGLGAQAAVAVKLPA